MVGDGQRLSDRAIERRARRWLRGGALVCFIQAAPGLEDLVARELQGAGLAGEVAAERGGATVTLDAAGIMRANLWLRTASRVLVRLASFPAAHEAMLFDQTSRVPWEVQLGSSGAFALRVSARGSRLQAGDGVARTVARGMAKRLRGLGLMARAVDDAPLTIHVRIVDDRATLSLDTSGEHLHRRGTRRHVHTAPVRETVAAAVALLAYDGHDLVIDPFCGSGTLLLEMADHVAGLAPGRRRSFAFEAAAWHRPGTWRAVLREAETAAERAGATPRPTIIGQDIDATALAAAEANVASAGHDRIRLARDDSRRLDLDRFACARGLIVANLPFGVRLGDSDDAAATVRAFLDRCAAATARWDLALLTTHPDLVATHRGVRVREVRTVVSGGLRVALVTGSVGGHDR